MAAPKTDATRCRDLARQVLARLKVPALPVAPPPVTLEAPPVPVVVDPVPTPVAVVAPAPRVHKSPPVPVPVSPADARHIFRVVTDDAHPTVYGVFPGRNGILAAQDLAKKLARRGGKYRVEKRAVDEATGEFARDKKTGVKLWVVMSYNALPGIATGIPSTRGWSNRARPEASEDRVESDGDDEG